MYSKHTLPTDKYVNVYGLGGQTYTYHHEEDESSFQLVDTAKMQRPLYQKGRPRFNQVYTYVYCTLQHSIVCVCVCVCVLCAYTVCTYVCVESSDV